MAQKHTHTGEKQNKINGKLKIWMFSENENGVDRERERETHWQKEAMGKINRCIVWQWYLFVAMTVSNTSALTTCAQTQSEACVHCTVASLNIAKTCYFKLSDSEWIFNQMNILFIYHLIRSNYFWAMDNFNHFHTTTFHSIFLHSLFVSIRQVQRHHTEFHRFYLISFTNFCLFLLQIYVPWK